MDAALPRKHLKIYKLTTTNAITMKLITIVYLHKTFHLKIKLERHPKGVRGRARKTSEKKPKIQIFGLISWNFQDSIKNRNIYHALPCTASLVKIFYKSDMTWGCDLQKTTQKQPKILLFAATRNLENI